MEPLPCLVCGDPPASGPGGDPWGLPLVLACPGGHGSVSAPTHDEAIAAWNALVSPHPKAVPIREDREVRGARREDGEAKGSGGAP